MAFTNQSWRGGKIHWGDNGPAPNGTVDEQYLSCLSILDGTEVANSILSLESARALDASIYEGASLLQEGLNQLTT